MLVMIATCLTALWTETTLNGDRIDEEYEVPIFDLANFGLGFPVLFASFNY